MVEVARADDEIAAAAVFDGARFGDERADVDDGADGVDFGGGAELVGVVHAILHADDGCAGREERGDGAGGGGACRLFSRRTKRDRRRGRLEFDRRLGRGRAL